MISVLRISHPVNPAIEIWEYLKNHAVDKTQKGTFTTIHYNVPWHITRKDYYNILQFNTLETWLNSCWVGWQQCTTIYQKHGWLTVKFTTIHYSLSEAMLIPTIQYRLSERFLVPCKVCNNTQQFIRNIS